MTKGEISSRRLISVAVVLITLGAALARLVNLSSQPGGLYPDEAAEGISAHQLLHQPGYNPVFLPADGGREALYNYLVSFAFRIFGENTTVLRGTSAVLGVLAVLAIGLALRRFGQIAALAGMAWAAGSLWLIAVSRDGMRNIICVTVGALILAALLRWHDVPRRRTAILAGAFVGLGLWTYQPLKFTPILVGLWLGTVWRCDRERVRQMLAGIKPAIVAFLVVAAPMLLTAIFQPAAYFGRGLGTSLLNPDSSGHEAFLAHTLRTLGQFLFTGDPNPRHDVAGLPLLGPVLFLLMAAGLTVCWRKRRQGAYSLLLWGLPIYLIAPLLATEGGSPHFLRNLGLAPFIAAYCGLGVRGIAGWVRHWADELSARLVLAFAAVGFLLLGLASTKAYFGRPAADVYSAYSYDLVTMARLASGGPADVVITDNYSAMDIEFLDANNLPTIIAPGKRLNNPAAYSLVVAHSLSDLVSAGGKDLANRAYVIAQFPSGPPSVYAVVP